MAKQEPAPRRILELGSGPGLLARRILEEVEVEEYVLFDFSPPMMQQAQKHLDGRKNVTYALGDFKTPTWPMTVSGPFDAVVSMQAIHEIRHKRHVPWLYAQTRELLRPGGLLAICDAERAGELTRELQQLGSTRREQKYAMLWAGFEEVECHKFEHDYYLISGRNPWSG